MLKVLHAGTLGTMQPHPPKDKQGSKKLRVYSAGRERLVSSDAVPGGRRKRSKTPPPSWRESKQQPLTLTEKTNHLTADVYSCTPAKDSTGAAPTPAESLSCSIRPGFSSDLLDWTSWETNEGTEPQLTLQGEVFTFSSQPHSPKRGQGQGDQEKTEMGDDQVQNKNGRRYEAQLEDDFIGSESDEDKSYNTFNPVTPRSSSPTLDLQLEVHPESHNINQTTPKELSPAATGMKSPSSVRAEPARLAPTRCRSPSATPSRQEVKCGPREAEVVNQVVDENSSVSLSRRFLQEVKLNDSTQHKVIILKAEDTNTLKPVDSSNYNLHVLSSLRMHGDDDHELRMLASLKREQEEYECRASGLSVSQIHHCNVSVSMSSDDASTWTHISTPANQGHHYQKEMNPLLQSNPREWMDVLSPPIMPPSQRRRSGNTWNNLEDLIGGRDESVDEEEKEDEYLNLLYDPCLNCYFDPKTGKYYELA
ncbi:uncharacterized protein C3orf67 homolog [Anarrhichthys ocellatus]|uniref:uncharacterized protein C3orf67 homolog n=1 Tax=Anarrhichthys ocellatus TaxID=433405 RepID=UPI0012EE2E70|nr:uncharacterized protein C3orf67 homolog [Anarrhichthys ocellatus]